MALIFLVACFYAGMVVINNTLLSFWAMDGVSYRYWFYPPAGVRLALILLLGWPGILGYFIAALALLHSPLILEIQEFHDAFWIASSRAISIWSALIAYGWITGVKTPWERLTWQHLPFLALFVSLVSACVAYLVRYMLELEQLDQIFRNISLTVMGDTLGSIAVLVVVVQLRRAYRRYQGIDKFNA